MLSQTLRKIRLPKSDYKALFMPPPPPPPPPPPIPVITKPPKPKPPEVDYWGVSIPRWG